MGIRINPITTCRFIAILNLTILLNTKRFVSSDVSSASPQSHPVTEQISFNAWKTILILTGTIILFVYLNTGMGATIPSVAEDFDISETSASWVMTSYMICGAVMTVIMGRLSDIVGAKKMLMVMMICFSVGTVLAPFSPNYAVLLGLRVLQGIAIASTPISTKLIRDGVPKTKFPIGLSIYLAGYSFGLALGGIMGPVVVADAGWQGNFYYCAPIAVILTLVCWRFIKSDESKKIYEHDNADKVPRPDAPKAKKLRMDYMGIATLTVTIVGFLLAITFIGSIATNLTPFVVSLIIGIIALVLFLIVEKRVKPPLVNLKLEFNAAILVGNVIMLMYGILEYIVITGTPQLGASPPPSGLGLDPLHTGFLQMAFGLSCMIFGPLIGILVAKRKGFNLKLLVPGIAVSAISFLILLFFHSGAAGINTGLFIFGIASAMIPNTVIVTIIGLTPMQYTGISSASTNMLRIIGGAIGPVITTVIITSATIPITVDNVEESYPDPITWNILFAVGAVMAIVSVILAIRMKRLATKMKPLTAEELA
jgi:MFS family permease